MNKKKTIYTLIVYFLKVLCIVFIYKCSSTKKNYMCILTALVLGVARSKLLAVILWKLHRIHTHYYDAGKS